jgi:hypothetical protein
MLQLAKALLRQHPVVLGVEQIGGGLGCNQPNADIQPHALTSRSA